MLPPRKPEVYARVRGSLGRLWNAPNTLLGLIAGLGGVYAWRREEQVCEVIDGWVIRRLSQWKLADAMTLGDVILYADLGMPFILREHELVHVRQFRAWGPLFLPAYLTESLYQQIRTGDGYRRNRFEAAAYRNDKTK